MRGRVDLDLVLLRQLADDLPHHAAFAQLQVVERRLAQLVGGEQRTPALDAAFAAQVEFLLHQPARIEVRRQQLLEFLPHPDCGAPSSIAGKSVRPRKHAYLLVRLHARRRRRAGFPGRRARRLRCPSISISCASAMAADRRRSTARGRPASSGRVTCHMPGPGNSPVTTTSSSGGSSAATGAEAARRPARRITTGRRARIRRQAVDARHRDSPTVLVQPGVTGTSARGRAELVDMDLQADPIERLHRQVREHAQAPLELRYACG